MRTSALVSLALAGVTTALPKISRVGKYLYDDKGDRFYIKGISYQEAGTLGEHEPGEFPEPIDFVDPLAIPSACSRDIPHLKDLTVNTIRVYSVDASKDHDECMAALDAAGIYTFIDLSLPVNGSITRVDPSWTTNLLNLYLGTVDAFLKYDNVIGFNIGNEVVANETHTITTPFIKAAARDVKSYLLSKGSSALVGYASTDGSEWRNELADYLTCGSEQTSIDIWGINNYRWCGEGQLGDYQEGIDAFTDLPIPAYFSEFGCVKGVDRPRPWTEVKAMFTEETFTNVFSGGIAFSYFSTNDAEDYGMVTIDGDTATTTAEFDNLVTQFSEITTFINTPARDSVTTPALPSCPAIVQDEWMGSTTLPPTPNQNECACTWDFLPCVFTPKGKDHTEMLAELFTTACTLLGEAGGSCDPLSANGNTGVYGKWSSCDPATKLSHIFSEFYLSTDSNPQSCDFAGNATVNAKAPKDARDIDDGIDACFAKDADVFTPTEPSVVPGIDLGSQSTGGPRPTNGGNNDNDDDNNNNDDSSAVSLLANSQLAVVLFSSIACLFAAGTLVM